MAEAPRDAAGTGPARTDDLREQRRERREGGEHPEECDACTFGMHTGCEPTFTCAECGRPSTCLCDCRAVAYVR